MVNEIHESVRIFRRDEGGALMIFGLMLLVLMLMMGGFAVDLMRYENTRTTLQNTLDRSVLAAASLTQTRSPEAVVRDYMLKAGLSEQLDKVKVTQALNSRTVSALGVADTNPFFLHMMGIDRFDAKGTSEARQTVSNIEIVLVLDVSGSMASNNKIGNLKIAASNFVDTVMANDTQNRVSIAIVPYNAQVNTGADIAGAFSVNNPNGVTDVNCFEPQRTAFSTGLALSRTAPLSMTAHADYSTATNRVNAHVNPGDATYAKPNYGGVFCKQNTYNAVRLPNNNVAQLKAQIAGLQAQGNTSITLGMKWGATMLDPAMRSAYAGFIANGKMSSSLPGRPFDYTDKQAVKYVILMTDGAHVAHNRIVDAFKYGPSNIFKSPEDGQFSVRFTTGRPIWAGANTYYVPHLATAANPALGWQAGPWNGGTELGWQDVWRDLKTQYVAWQFYARALGISDANRATLFTNRINDMVQTYASATDMDTSLNQTCDFVKAQGVTVYGIAFEAPPVGQTAIRKCSTDPERGSRYFAANGPEIQTAFQTIAANISMLRLTQ